MAHYDVAVIGGGIVGLATAYTLCRPSTLCRVLVLEKEDHLAEHQTGHNSGVLHTGIYYRPGSIKARNCREGKRMMEQFCREQQLPFEICGKVIVATHQQELPILENILRRGEQNRVPCRRIDRQELIRMEPHVQGVAAIHVPEAGIVDFRRVATRMADLIAQRGGDIRTQQRVTRIRALGGGRSLIETPHDAFTARYLVNCAGLQSDRVTRMTGQRPPVQIVPFRGEYYELKPEAKHLCRNLIYPVPDPRFPFLGVHFTRMIGGQVECGPNAVLALAREGYRKLDVNVRDLGEAFAYRGFRRLVRRYWPMGIAEMWRSLNKGAFVAALQRLIPEVRRRDIQPAPAGVRAQAVTIDGELLDDFAIVAAGRVVNVVNAPSPAATSSLNIARQITDELAALGLDR